MEVRLILVLRGIEARSRDPEVVLSAAIEKLVSVQYCPNYQLESCSSNLSKIEGDRHSNSVWLS
jgi:hypothetical protein